MFGFWKVSYIVGTSLVPENVSGYGNCPGMGTVRKGNLSLFKYLENVTLRAFHPVTEPDTQELSSATHK